MPKEFSEAVKKLQSAGFKQGKICNTGLYKTVNYSGITKDGCELNLYISYNDIAIRTEGFLTRPNGISSKVYDINGIQGLHTVIDQSKRNLIPRRK